jgi:predicted thioesterase
MSFKVRTAEASRVAFPSQLYSPDDSSGAALSTSRMIELMELAAHRLMKPLLAEGQSSVSIATEVLYAAPSATRQAGGNVRAVANYLGRAGRLHRFTVNAFDESGLIGSAAHTRSVVNERRLLALPGRRPAKPSIRLEVQHDHPRTST